MLVVGTAGHVDHGKSALVKALTGIDPDRLREEKEREMTIDLGFAWLTLPSGRLVSVIDVPGHEDFIKNMLAGVGGMDAVLLVVAADEGVMPQTREHLAILGLLEIRSGVIVLSKVDLVEDPEWLELVKEEIREELAGSVLEGSPLVAVSAKTGQGLDLLLEALDRLLAEVPPREDLGRPRLGIDRVFTISGFGTVVTGTLLDGALSVGQEVEVLPQGIKARIRGLEVHKSAVERAEAGSRAAVNLAGLEKERLSRGQVVTTPGWLLPTPMVDAQIRVLPDSPLLAHGMTLDFFAGSCERKARLRLLEDEELLPGEAGWAQLLLAEPAAVLRGDRFVLRRPSPSITLGGGWVVDAHPPRRHRRFHPRVAERLEGLASPDEVKVLLWMLKERESCLASELAGYSGLPPRAFPQALERAIERGQVLALGEAGASPGVPWEGQYLFSREGWLAEAERLRALVRAYHDEYPLRPGMPREVLKSRLGHPARLFGAVLEAALREGILAEEGEDLRLPEHKVAFTLEEEKRVQELMASFRANPYSPPSWAEVEAAVGRPVLEALIGRGELVRLSDSVLYLAETYQEMVGKVLEHIRREKTITLAQVRDTFGTSRKYAQALLEYLDREKLTRRVGDERVLA